MTVVVVLLAWLIGAQAQAPLPETPGTAVIRGHIIRADGPPIAHAEVRLVAPDKPGDARVTLTDDGGRYDFEALPAGRYTVTASKTGFVSREFGQERALEPGRPIQIRTGEARERVDIALPRHGAIVGRVVDENGEPLEGITVSAKEIRSVGGHRRVATVSGVTARQTNELGRYRVYGLQPGDYVISAEVAQTGSDEVRGFPMTYFPGTINPDQAQQIHIGWSDEVSNIDFALAPVRTARITGRTVTSSGEQFQAGVQMRASWRSTGAIAEAVGARAQPDGNFEFVSVPPGEYVIQAFKGSEIGWQLVTVGGADVTDLTVATLPGSTVSGRVTFEGGDPPPARTLEIVPAPADPDQTPFFGAPGRADIHDDWTFELTDAIGPARLSVSRTPSGWALSRIIVNALDATDAVLPFGTSDQSLRDVQIVLTNQVTRLSGNVADSSRAVIAFTEDRDRWYQGSRFLAAARTTPAGMFNITGLPTGSYFVIAVDRLPDDDAWQEAGFLAPLASRATRITLSEGQPRSLTLTGNRH
jgi:protocatechuate 3,4-dioxygenase beta subunit